MTYDDLLKNAPPHNSPAFLDYLRANNPVEWEDDDWLVIRNFKYGWLTAFAKNSVPTIWRLDDKYGPYEWRKKAADKQTVKRFHIHIITNESSKKKPSDLDAVAEEIMTDVWFRKLDELPFAIQRGNQEQSRKIIEAAKVIMAEDIRQYLDEQAR